MIRTLIQKDLVNFIDFCSKRDQFSDFYITVDNKRLFLNNAKVATKVFYNILKRNDKCFISEKGGDIKGIALVTGYADKFSRKYLKLYSDDPIIIDDLLRMVGWQVNSDLYIKVKKENPLSEICLGTYSFNYIFKVKSPNSYKGFGFHMQGTRDKEILLYRRFDKELAKHRKFQYVKEGDLEPCP